MQMTTQYDLDLQQTDDKAAYLHAPIDCNVYMDQLEGLDVKLKTGEKLMCKLNYSLYGMKQAKKKKNAGWFLDLKNDF